MNLPIEYFWQAMFLTSIIPAIFVWITTLILVSPKMQINSLDLTFGVKKFSVIMAYYVLVSAGFMYAIDWMAG